MATPNVYVLLQRLQKKTNFTVYQEIKGFISFVFKFTKQSGLKNKSLLRNRECHLDQHILSDMKEHSEIKRMP